jgi:hypothetical protein
VQLPTFKILSLDPDHIEIGLVDDEWIDQRSFELASLLVFRVLGECDPEAEDVRNSVSLALRMAYDSDALGRCPFTGRWGFVFTDKRSKTAELN